MTYNAVDLVRKWRSVVNENINIGRDSSLIKEALVKYTPAQILHGMYLQSDSKTITIPIFLRQPDDWLEEDEQWAEVLLAIDISNHIPADFYVYKDLVTEEDSHSRQLSIAARKRLNDWAAKVTA